MDFSKIFNIFISLFMALITSITSFFGSVGESISNVVDYFTQPSVIQDFEEKDDDTIRIMSFNIRYGDVGYATREDREPLVEATIRNGHPDSVGLQEATPEWMSYLTAALGDEYAYVGVGRDNGIDEGEYAAIFYLKDKYTAIDSGTFWLSDTPEVPSLGWGAYCYRICTWVVLENNETGEQYVHMNAHFDYANDDVMYNSANMINEFASKYSDLPVVYTADMNFNEGSDYYNKMLDSGVLFDTKSTAEDTMDYLTYHDSKPFMHSGNVIDFIMVNAKFDAEVYRVVTAGIDGKYVSDHFPIYADIKFAD